VLGDHTGGNRQVMAATGAQLLAHHAADIDDVNQGLNAGDVIKVGRSVELEVLDTPGHTMSHVCLLSHTDTPGLFCGDTLFNAGAGNCHNGGHPKELYGTFANQLSKLSDSTLIYPGHDYIANNLEYTLDREPDNSRAQHLLRDVKDQDPNEALISNLGLEKEVNTFLRLQSPSVIAKLRERFPDIGEHPNPETVFLKLRELRNSW
jgi:hydroxyacylglutathione hydrolase